MATTINLNEQRDDYARARELQRQRRLAQNQARMAEMANAAPQSPASALGSRPVTPSSGSDMRVPDQAPTASRAALVGEQQRDRLNMIKERALKAAQATATVRRIRVAAAVISWIGTALASSVSVLVSLIAVLWPYILVALFLATIWHYLPSPTTNITNTVPPAAP